MTKRELEEELGNSLLELALGAEAAQRRGRG